jgi:hypothetical protein
VRDPETALDEVIRIICIICQIAKLAGKQYTKRILPTFLRPNCRVRLDLVFAFYQAHSKADRYDLESGCDWLGCLDKRTVTRHLAVMRKAVGQSNTELAAFLAHRPGFANLVQVEPPMQELTILDELSKQVKAFMLQLGQPALLAESDYTALKLIHEHLCGVKFSITYVSFPPPTYDTS